MEHRRIIEQAWDNRELLKEKDVQCTIEEVIEMLDNGSLRVAEKSLLAQNTMSLMVGLKQEKITIQQIYPSEPCEMWYYPHLKPRLMRGQAPQCQLSTTLMGSQPALIHLL